MRVTQRLGKPAVEPQEMYPIYAADFAPKAPRFPRHAPRVLNGVCCATPPLMPTPWV